MMTAAGLARSPFRDLSATRAIRRGLLISHLIGFSLFVTIFFDRIWSRSLPYTQLVDVPIRLLAIFMLLDRTGRNARVRLNIWDALQISFVALYGVALVAADSFLVRNSGLVNYVEWILDFGNPYLIFLLVREGALRKGFRLDVVLAWTVGTLAAAGLLGIMQAADVLGVREMSANLYRWAHYDLKIVGPSAEWQARGPMPHANSLAFLMVLGFAMVPALARYPLMRIWAYAAGVVFVAATVATYSRMGLLCLIVLMVGFAIFALSVRKIGAATGWLVGVAAFVVLGVSLAYVFEVKRFTAAFEGEGVVKNNREELGGWRVREEGMRKAIQLGSEYPLFGLGATGAGTNRPDVLVRSEYSFGTILTGLYTYAFIQFGAVGLLYVAGCLGYFLSFIARRGPPDALRCSLFAVGLATACFGISENSLFLPYAVNILQLIAAVGAVALLRPEVAQ